MSYAEDLPYWKTSQSSPDRWLTKAATEIERAGGRVISEGYGRHEGMASFLLRFELDGETFKVLWPVLESKYEGADEKPAFRLAAQRQAATMLYHDVKSSCVKARAMGARIAFFAHLEVPDGRVASQLSGAEVADVFPKMLAAGEVVEVVDAEVVE